MLRSARELSDLIAAVYEAGRDPTDARWRAMLARLAPSMGGGGAMPGQRGRITYARVRGALVADDLDALALLLPHLVGALRTSLRLGEHGAVERAAADALDHWRQAVILVDGDARVHTANQAGEALLRAADGIAREPARGAGPDRLRAATPATTLALRHLLAGAAIVAERRDATTDRVAAAPCPMALRLERPSGRPALVAIVTPLRRGRTASDDSVDIVAPSDGDASVAVFVSDPIATTGDDDCLVRSRLRAAFGLTPAEAAVAVALAAGVGLRAVAAAHGVTLATVRTQARQVFRKTGVRGQTALARLVERLAQVR